jgi:hypothetical protein
VPLEAFLAVLNIGAAGCVGGRAADTRPANRGQKS